MGMTISVIICTHNRSTYLAKALKSALSQSVYPHEFEIIVVDNCSTDATKETVDQLSDGKVKYLYEPTLGLSYARNTGWKNARGKYVAYLDDDAIASPNWLAEILASFETAPDHTKLGCVGGKTEGIWESSRPSWISDDLVTCLTVIDWSKETKIISDLSQEWLVGANIAFPKTALEDVNGFASGLDRAGKKLLSSGDIFLQKQLQKAGYSCQYNPHVLVGHHIQASRLTKKWFYTRYFWQGVSDAMMELIAVDLSKSSRIRGALARSFKLLANPKNLLNFVLPDEDPRKFTEKCFTLIEFGHIFGLLSL